MAVLLGCPVGFSLWGCAGQGEVRCVRPRGCCVFVCLFVFVRGARPVPPCFCSVGGGTPVGGGYCLWLRVCVWLWWRHGGCRPAPHLKQSKGDHQWGLMFGSAWGSCVLVDKRHGGAPGTGGHPAHPARLIFLSFVFACTPTPAWFWCLCRVPVCFVSLRCVCRVIVSVSFMERHRWRLTQGRRFGMCILAVVSFSVFISARVLV